MSLARRQALISGIAWWIIFVAFAAIFFQTGPEEFGSPEGKQARSVTAAAIILPGYVINFLIQWRSRRGRRAGELDERDKAIERSASEYTLIVLTMVFFLGSLGLYESSLDRQTVPVGWLYFMAYGTVALVSLLHPTLSLITDFFGRVDG